MSELETPDRRESRPGRQLIWMLVGFIATFFAVDQLIASVRLPETVWSAGSPLRLLEDYQHAEGRANVFFLGCSYTAFGVDPETIDAEAQRLGADVHSMNFGFGGALTVADTRLFELLLASGRPLPKVVYYELSPGMLNRRIPSLRYTVGQIGGWREAALLWSLSPADRSEAVLSQMLAGHSRWNSIRTLVECAREGAPVFATKFRRSDRGHLAWSCPPPARSALVAQRVAERTTYWGKYVIDDFAIDAVLRFDALARAHGITVRYFEMPMSEAWRQVISEDIRGAYAGALARLEAAGLAAPWRCPPGLVTEDDYFDADHLLAGGARKVSQALASDVARVFLSAPDAPTDR